MTVYSGKGQCFYKRDGRVAQWVACLTRIVEVVGSSAIKGPVVSLSKKLYPYSLVLVGSRNQERIRA